MNEICRSSNNHLDHIQQKITEALTLENCVKLANAAIMLWPAEYAKLPIEQLTATCLQISAATRVTVTKTQGPPLIDLQKCVPSLTLSYGLFQIQIFIEFVSFRFDSRLLTIQSWVELTGLS